MSVGFQTSGRKRRKKTVDDVDLAPVSSPQYIDNVDDDFGSELTDNSQVCYYSCGCFKSVLLTVFFSMFECHIFLLFY
jgi:hypothetical protein